MIILQTQKEQLKQLLVQELNDQLTTLVDVEEISFGIIRHFPKVTANLNKVTIFSAKSFKSEQFDEINSDTLLHADNIFFKLNLIGLLKKKVAFNSVILSDAELHIKIDKNKGKNYQIFKPSDDINSKGLSFDINNLILKNIRVSYHDLLNNTAFNGTLRDLKITFRNENSRVRFRSNIFFNELISKNKTLLINQSLTTNIELNGKNKNYTISAGKINYSGLTIDVSGNLNAGNDIFLDLTLQGINNSSQNLVNVLPEFQRMKLNRFKSKGKLSFNGTINGNLGNGNFPHLQADFKLRQGSFRDAKTNLLFSDILLSGSFNNGESNNSSSTTIQINSFSALYKKEKIIGNYQLNNLQNPEMQLSMAGNIILDGLDKLLPSGTLDILKGSVRANVKFSGRIEDFRKFTLNDLEKTGLVGHLEFKNVEFKSTKSPIVYSSASGSVMLGKHVWLDDFSIMINDNPVSITGEVRNILSYLNGKKKPVTIKGNLYSPEFDLTKLLSKKKNPVKESSALTKIRFPEYFIAQIQVDAKKFSFNKFFSENLRSVLFYEPGALFIDSVSFNAMGGNVTGNSVVFQKPDNLFLLQVHSNLENIDIRELFYQLNNFGQKFIINDNLKGKISGEVNFYSEWTNSLKILSKSIIAESNFVIENGQLIQFEPIQSLSRFIAVEELENISFSELTNEIYIKDELITIPQMEIHTSAFNLLASGTHHFNNHFNYKFRILLSEILASKAGRAKKENQEFGIIEDNGLSKTIPIKIVGSPENIKVSYDSKEMTRSVKENLKKQGRDLKKIFQEEFDLIRKDSVSLPSKNETKKFLIEWDENKSQSTDSSSGKSTKFNILWEEDEEKKDSTKIKTGIY
jgi:hypothetical protein